VRGHLRCGVSLEDQAAGLTPLVPGGDRRHYCSGGIPLDRHELHQRGSFLDAWHQRCYHLMYVVLETTGPYRFLITVVEQLSDHAVSLPR